MNIHTQEETHRNADMERITELLTIGTERLDTNTVETLRRSRLSALGRQKIHMQPASLTTAGGIHWPIPHSARLWAAMLLIAMLIGGAGYWQHLRKHEMMAHLDVAILTDDMPMEIFVDR